MDLLSLQRYLEALPQTFILCETEINFKCMESNLPEFENRQELIIADETALNLRSAMVWAKFLAIAGFVITGMLFIMSLLLLINPLLFLSQDVDILSLTSLEAAMPGRHLMGITYLIMCVVMFGIYYFLFMGSAKIKKAIDDNERTALVQGTRNLKYFFQVQGIITIISLSVIILMIIFSAIFLSAMI